MLVQTMNHFEQKNSKTLLELKVISIGITFFELNSIHFSFTILCFNNYLSPILLSFLVDENEYELDQTRWTVCMDHHLTSQLILLNFVY